MDRNKLLKAQMVDLPMNGHISFYIAFFPIKYDNLCHLAKFLRHSTFILITFLPPCYLSLHVTLYTHD